MTGGGGERPFLLIGEVLDQLKVDFPDVTISKIRFLESQGLVEPERTPSGYRKFHEADVARLRWILRQQREHFLPLKVIKDRLEREGEAVAAPAAGPASSDGEGDGQLALPDDGAGAGESLGESGGAPSTVTPAVPDRAGSDADVLTGGLSSASFTRAELAGASGCDEAALADLERYGLLTGTAVGGTTSFDEESLVVARMAAGFARHGVEARHLRMYKTSADREASLFEQVVLPLVRQRDPAARRQSIEVLVELVRLGDGLRATLLRQALRPHAGGS